MVREVLSSFSPNVVINAAAYTAVDKAEADRDAAFSTNSTGAENVGRAAAERGTRVIHISTDYVFGGDQTTPYLPSAKPGPLNCYGESKLSGELALLRADAAALIVRTGWLYSGERNTFLAKILLRLQSGDPVRVVDDQIGVPTCARDLARALWQCVSLPSIRGVQHWVNAGSASWYEFAVRIRKRGEEFGLVKDVPQVLPISSEAYASAAVRPRFSVLDASALWRALGTTPRKWSDALDEVLSESAPSAV
jgi:dTDP-4-dehydrorhamnose reductase